jgi:O-antigen ligase
MPGLVMAKLISQRVLMALFGALVIAGFYASSSAGAALSLGSILSYTLRGGVVMLAALLLAIGARAGVVREPIALVLLLLFGFLYALKSFYVTAVVATVPTERATYAVAYFLAVCLIPALVPHFSRAFVLNDMWIAGLSFAALCLFGASIYAQGAMTAFGVEEGRLSLDSMGPIQVGHLGATCCIVAMALRGRSRALLRLCLFIGGLLVMGFSGTRSALLAVIVCLGLLSYKKSVAGFVRMLIVVFAFVLVATVYWYSDSGDIAVVERLTRLADASDDSGSGRLDIYAETVSEIARHPFIGPGLTYLRSGFYPHNLFLEAYFATGVVGGTLVVIYLGLALASAWRHFMHGEPQMLLPSLLFLQYFIASMMSGAIYAWGQLWFLGALLLTSRMAAPVVVAPGRLGVALPARGSQ